MRDTKLKKKSVSIGASQNIENEEKNNFLTSENRAGNVKITSRQHKLDLFVS